MTKYDHGTPQHNIHRSAQKSHVYPRGVMAERENVILQNQTILGQAAMLSKTQINSNQRVPAGFQLAHDGGNRLFRRELRNRQILLANNQPRHVQRDWLDTAGDIASGVGRGIYSVGEDIVGGAARTARGLNVFDSDELAQIGVEDIRAFELIKLLVTNWNTIEETCTTVVDYIYETLPEPQKAKMRAMATKGASVGGGYILGRIVIGSTIAKSIARLIAGRIAASETFRMLAIRLGVSEGAGATGIGVPIMLLMLQGVLERASKASRRLAGQYPELYQALSQKNLDMAWFLIEPHLDDLRQAVIDQLQAHEEPGVTATR